MEGKEIKKGGFLEYKSTVILVAVISMILTSGVLATEYCTSSNTKPVIITSNEQESSPFNSPAQLAVLAYAKNLTATEEDYIKQIDSALSTLRNKLKTHPMYSEMKLEENVITFMNTHVFCVWDFMNLVKRLQIYFTSVQVPWRPTLDVQKRFLRRLTNEIVLEEETDELDGKFISHFSYYIDSIRQVQGGVISDKLTRFIEDISNEEISYNDIVNREYLPNGVRKFLQSTANTAVHENIIIVAAAFTFGREVMLPEIFTSILKESGIANQPRLSMFVNYLDRHIELDGDYHGYLSKKMVLKLVSNQAEWDLVIETAKMALESRLALWDDIYKHLL